MSSIFIKSPTNSFSARRGTQTHDLFIIINNKDNDNIIIIIILLILATKNNSIYLFIYSFSVYLFATLFHSVYYLREENFFLKSFSKVSKFIKF